MNNKKLSLVIALVIISANLFSQDTTGYYQKILTKFEKVVVEPSFKDPSSFKLLSLTYKPITYLDELQDQISRYNSEIVFFKQTISQCNSDFSPYPKSKRKDVVADYTSRIQVNTRQIALLNNKISSLTETQKNEILKYIVRLECNGTNSYGGVVRSNYIAYYYHITDTNQVEALNIVKS
jgi:hypothetical protein